MPKESGGLQCCCCFVVVVVGRGGVNASLIPMNGPLDSMGWGRFDRLCPSFIYFTRVPRDAEGGGINAQHSSVLLLPLFTLQPALIICFFHLLA